MINLVAPSYGKAGSDASWSLAPGEIGFEEFLQVVFEAGRKSVEAAEAAKEQRAQQLLRNPHLVRGAQRTRPKVLLSNALRHPGQRSPVAASIPG